MADLYDPSGDGQIFRYGSQVAMDNPDAWLARMNNADFDAITRAAGSGWTTTLEDTGMASNGGGFFDDLSSAFTGIGNAAQSLFGTFGTVQDAFYDAKYGDQSEVLAAQAAANNAKLMQYALIGGAVLIAILLLKD